MCILICTKFKSVYSTMTFKKNLVLCISRTKIQVMNVIMILRRNLIMLNLLHFYLHINRVQSLLSLACRVFVRPSSFLHSFHVSHTIHTSFAAYLFTDNSIIAKYLPRNFTTVHLTRWFFDYLVDLIFVHCTTRHTSIYGLVLSLSRLSRHTNRYIYNNKPLVVSTFKSIPIHTVTHLTSASTVLFSIFQVSFRPPPVQRSTIRVPRVRHQHLPHDGTSLRTLVSFRFETHT